MSPDERSNRSFRSPRRDGPAQPGGSRGKKSAGKPDGAHERSERPFPSSGRPGAPGKPDRPGRPRSFDSKQPPRQAKEDGTPDDRPQFPPLLPEVAPDQLDRQARRELSGLDKADAEFVAKHLVMASIVIEDDPALAHEHAKAALHKGSRIPVVRETMGITAYLGGDFALALRELRTHRRLAGSNAGLPMMIDAERGLGRPERGLELARGIDRTEFGDQWAVELAIALSGCRLDLGQTEQALTELQIPQLKPDVAFSYSPDLFDAYAVVLEDLGRQDEATLWGERASVAAQVLAEKQWRDKDDVGDVADALEGDSDGHGGEKHHSPEATLIPPPVAHPEPSETLPSDNEDG